MTASVVRSANVGYAGGINRGVREASPADAILVLNPDVRLKAGSVAPLLDALHQPGTGIVVPQLRSADGTLEPSLRREPTLLRALGLEKTGMAALSERVADAEEYTYPHRVDWAQGAVVLMSRACFDALNGWDESFFLYSEETDLSLRARDLGLLTRYEPGSVAVHIGGPVRHQQPDTRHADREPGAPVPPPQPAAGVVVLLLARHRQRGDVVAAWAPAVTVRHRRPAAAFAAPAGAELLEPAPAAVTPPSPQTAGPGPHGGA